MAEAAQILPAEIKRTILFRQIVFLVSIAASVALGVYVVLWSQTPNYTVLYGSLSHQDVNDVMSSLQKSGVKYKIDENSGAVMVPSASLHEVKMQLAAEGLPKNVNQGFSMLQEEQGFGTSQFIEQARYQHALESELSKTIEKVSSVRSARVHLAIPKQSPFARNKKPSRASVFLDIYSGHLLQQEHVAAIANLVASSVPNLDFKNVSIVDQHGRLMTHSSASEDIMLSNSQFQYVRSVEQSFVKRIEDILTPIVGMNGVKAQVTAEMDFTSTEQTREIYNPDLSVVRSEQVEEELQRGGQGGGGVAGALSNQPPADATVTDITASGQTPVNEIAEGSTETSRHKRSTRNYELDKTISHTRLPTGTMRRLSVAVLLDYKTQTDSSGTVTRIEHSPEELEQITSLVKEAIGYSEIRGDSVSVVNAAFSNPGPVEELPATPIWKQAWVWDTAKQVLGGLFVLFLLFGVLKPSMKNLVSKEMTVHQAALAGPNVAMSMEPGSPAQLQAQNTGQLPAAAGSATAQLAAPIQTYDDSLSAVRGLVKNDPKLAAQVVKKWVGEE